MDWDEFLFSRLLIAVPELHFDKDFFDFARRRGIISREEAAAYERVTDSVRKAQKAKNFVRSMRGRSLLQRIMMVAPELLSVRSVDFLRSAGLITVEQGHILRIGLRASGALLPAPLSELTMGNRLEQLFGSVVSSEMVSLIRDMEDAKILALRSAFLRNTTGKTRLTKQEIEIVRNMAIASVRRAQRLRSGIAAGRLLGTTISSARAANNRWDAISVVLESLLSDELLKNAIRAGAISPERYDLIRALEALGLDAWRKGLKIQSYNSWAARALLISEGVISQEMINVLLRAKLISPELAAYLRPAARAIRYITRGRLAQYMSSDRMRVIPGEAPIRTYARVTQTTDRAILKLLAEAAEDSRKRAEALARTRAFGKMTRAQQERLVTAELHQQMRILWESVGHLTIFGEKEAARAALSANEWLQRRLLRQDPAVMRMLEAQARSGVDAFISRQENLIDLSPRVYKNMALSNRWVQREVNKALLRGLDAREMADLVSRLIRPNVRGGVSYAAMRLARTEINNAFHFTQIRHTREMPWVTGYKWNLSRSHPDVDICNDMASRNHDGIGRGVYKKKNVPGKPHPHCFCFLTTITADPGTFEKRLRSGAYNRYLRDVERHGVFNAPHATAETVRSAAMDWVTDAAKFSGQVLALGAGAAVLRELRRS